MRFAILTFALLYSSATLADEPILHTDKSVVCRKGSVSASWEGHSTLDNASFGCTADGYPMLTFDTSPSCVLDENGKAYCR